MILMKKAEKRRRPTHRVSGSSKADATTVECLGTRVKIVQRKTTTKTNKVGEAIRVMAMVDIETMAKTMVAGHQDSTENVTIVERKDTKRQTVGHFMVALEKIDQERVQQRRQMPQETVKLLSSLKEMNKLNASCSQALMIPSWMIFWK